MGLVGCGKTVLCVSAFDYVEKLHSIMDKRLCQFYCDWKDNTRQALTALLRRMLATFCVPEFVPEQLQSLYQDCHSVYPAKIPSLKQLRETCMEIFNAQCHEIQETCPIAEPYEKVEPSMSDFYLFIDALDEISESNREEFLDFLQDLGVARLCKLHIMVSSRNDADIEAALTGSRVWDTFNISKESNSHDIRNFVSDSIFKSPRLRNFCMAHVDIEQLILQSLVEQANGM